jgi:hypothetical protein
MATAKPHNPLEAMSEMRQKLVRETLRNEFADFFLQMTTSTGPQWPDINDQELVDAIADALVMLGRHRGVGVALLQTLVYELQDRVNQNLN